jgi:DNA repair protein RecN (Recombination protein N)
MLTQIAIRNVLLIDQIEVDVPDGLLVLTGETGAGKSILLDSLGLALGERSEANLVRQGAEQASVTLAFNLPKTHEAQTLLSELGLRDQASTEPVILRRIINRDGRSRAFVDDQPVAIGALRKLGSLLVDIHGQFETHGLLNHENHRGYLDDYGQFSGKLQALREHYQQWHAARAALQAAASQNESAVRLSDDLRHSIDELRKLNPQPQEADALAERRMRMQQKEKIIEALQAANVALQGDDGAATQMMAARRILLRAEEKAPNLLQSVLVPLQQAEDTLNEAAAALDSLMQGDDFDAGALEKIEDRLFALRGAARKYQVPVEELAPYAAKLETQLAQIENSGVTLRKLEAEANKCFKAYFDLAESLHAAREKAAKNLEAAMQKELTPLKLEKALLSIHVDRLGEEQAGPFGISRITFGGKTNPDMPEGPLHKIASGGELARFMLALRLCLAESAQTTTLIFDEVDTGIGGATADAVGERLSRLGKHMQTLVITHSPQVAARGAHHWRVEKNQKAGITCTALKALDSAQRREEIARMLAGSEVTDAARQAATSLLHGEAPTQPKKRKAS